MPIRTALTLTEDQIQRMTRYVRARMDAIEVERSKGWIAERERFDREWNDDFTHRAKESTVFSKSNETLNLVGSGVDYIHARLVEEIFSSKPWFAADPENAGGSDPILADEVRRHLGWKLGPGQIDFPTAGGQIILKSCKLGECVSKITYRRDAEQFEKMASILHEDGKPVIDAEGEFIFQDKGIESTSMESPALPEAEEGARIAVDAEEAPSAPYAHPAGHPEIVLGGFDEGGNIVLDDRYSWQEMIVTDEVVNYSGAEVIPMHFKEFFCPLNVPDIHKASFVGHLTSMRLSQLRAQLGVDEETANPDSEVKNGEQETSQAGKMGNFDAYLRNVLVRLKTETTKAKGDADKPMGAEGPAPDVADGDPEFRYLEAYFEFDARQTGRPQRIFLTMAYDYDLPIFWDYIQNVTPEGRYPFEATALIPEDGRWYGVSWFKKYASFQKLIDKFLNQIIYRNELAANPIKFRRKEAVVQWQDDQPFEVGPDKVFDLNDGYTAEDALQTAKIPELDGQTQFLLETVVANWRTRSGVSTSTQGSFGEMPAEKTARGVSQIAASGNTMFKPVVINAKRGLERVLTATAKTQYAYQDAEETFTYMEGEILMVGALNPEKIRDWKFNVRLTLTNMRQAENLEKNQLAAKVFNEFLAVPDPFKPVAAPLYAVILKNLGIDNGSEYFQQITEISQQIAAAQAQQEALNDNRAENGAGGGAGGEAAPPQDGEFGSEEAFG